MLLACRKSVSISLKSSKHFLKRNMSWVDRQTWPTYYMSNLHTLPEETLYQDGTT